MVMFICVHVYSVCISGVFGFGLLSWSVGPGLGYISRVEMPVYYC